MLQDSDAQGSLSTVPGWEQGGMGGQSAAWGGASIDPMPPHNSMYTHPAAQPMPSMVGTCCLLKAVLPLDLACMQGVSSSTEFSPP